MLHGQSLYGGYFTARGVTKIQSGKLHHPLTRSLLSVLIITSVHVSVTILYTVSLCIT